MIEKEPVHEVTLSSMYEKLDTVDDNVKLLLERESTLRLAERVNKLERVVYWVGIPIGSLAAVVLGLDALIKTLI